MVPDLIFAILMILAVIKGYQRGLIVGIFSFLAIIIGLAAAIKLSAVVATYVGNSVKVSDRWLPVVSFALVFLGVVLLVRLGANMLQKTVEWGMLGWANRLGGILFYAAIFTIVYSIFLFYAEKLNILQPATAEKSVVYSLIRPWGPSMINAFGSVIPVFKDMFAELESFFEGVSHQVS